MCTGHKLEIIDFRLAFVRKTIVMQGLEFEFINDKLNFGLDIATIRMSGVEIPCNTCLFWNKVNKSFSCDPNKCVRLSEWLLKHASKMPNNPWVEELQYVV